MTWECRRDCFLQNKLDLLYRKKMFFAIKEEILISKLFQIAFNYLGRLVLILRSGDIDGKVGREEVSCSVS